MRNTLLPLALAAALTAVGLLLIRPNVERGQGGPALAAGILRLPSRDPLRTPSAELSGSTGARFLAGGREDGRWRSATIVGLDRSPVTHAAMLALGETLHLAGIAVLMAPQPTAADTGPPLPLPADRIIAVGTRAAATPTADGPWQATVEISVQEPRLPAGHPAAGLQPPAAAAPAALVVEHAARPATAAPSWPARWAATGRAIAQAGLGELTGRDGPRLPEGSALAAWGTPVPFPPTTPELRWAGCFQHDLVRGWIGRVDGLRVATRGGGDEDAVAPLLRLIARGEWQEVAGGPWRLWSRLRDGAQQWFALRADGTGWEATMWVERPDRPGLVASLAAAAQGGDAGARERLRRIAACPDLPEDVRRSLPAGMP